MKRTGKNFKIERNVFIGGFHNIEIGDNIFIGFGAVIVGGGGLKIEDNVLIAQGVKIYSETHTYADKNIDIMFQKEEFKKVIIGKGTWLCANSIILPGVSIGKHCVIAAGSVVTKNVPDFSIVAGIPAKLMKKIE